MRPVAWCDGKVVPADEVRIGPGDSAWREGLGAYGTARWTGRGLRHGERVAARLARDVARLELGALDAAAAERALRELGEAAFGSGEGIVRLQASRDANRGLRLVGTPRPTGPEPARWRASCAPFAHPGPGPFAGVKLSGEPTVARARALTRERGTDETLLFDAAGRLVEGARAALVVVDETGRLATPPLARGGVASVARALLLEALPELGEHDVELETLRRARELIAVNAVRGARPIAEVDGRGVAGGPWAARLAELLDAAA